MDLPAFMAEHLQRAEPHRLRTMMSKSGQGLMSAEADAIYGVGQGAPTPDPTNLRHGCRTRDFAT